MQRHARIFLAAPHDPWGRALVKMSSVGSFLCSKILPGPRLAPVQAQVQAPVRACHWHHRAGLAPLQMQVHLI